MCSKNLTNKKQKIFSEKQKGFRYGLSYSTPQQSEETRGNAITQPRSHSITLGQQPLIQTAKNFTTRVQGRELFLSPIVHGRRETTHTMATRAILKPSTDTTKPLDAPTHLPFVLTQNLSAEDIAD